MTQYLVFESRGYHFALPMSIVDNVSEDVHDGSGSFSRYFFNESESEPCCIVLTNSKCIRVHRFHEIVSLTETILPIPGYVFEIEARQARGIIWSSSPKMIVLNEELLLERL